MTNRGIRNNSPMNIRISTNKWEGKVTPNTDGTFEQFNTAEDGIRAGAKLLLTYHVMYKLNTVRLLCNRFAPASENNTSKYIDDIVKQTGFGADQVLDFDDYSTMLALVKAIVQNESGGKYSDEVYRSALKRAGVAETPKKPVMQEPAVKMTTVLAGGGALGVATQVVTTLAPLSDTLSGLMNVAPWAVGAIVVLVVGYILYNAIKNRT